MQLKDDYHIREYELIEEIPKDINSLIFCAYNLNLQKIILNGKDFKLLMQLKIGVNNFSGVEEFIVEGFENLINIKIDEENFNLNKRGNGRLEIKNCPKLLIITIGSNNFNNYKEMILEGLDNLLHLEIGCKSFGGMEIFEIKGINLEKKT